MKIKNHIFIMLLSLLLIISCGSGGGGDDDGKNPAPADTEHAPVISNLVIYPNPVGTNEYVYLEVDSYDEDNDILGGKACLENTSTGAEVCIDIDVSIGDGNKVTVFILSSIFLAGNTYEYNIRIIDVGGNSSNILTGQFSVVSYAPVISNLIVYPSIVSLYDYVSFTVDCYDYDEDIIGGYICLENTVSLDTTCFDILDTGTGSDVITLLLYISPLNFLSGYIYQYNVYVIDNTGNSSNKLTGIFTVY